MATQTPDGILSLIELLEQPRTWVGLPGYGDSFRWESADGLLVTLRVDDDGQPTWSVSQSLPA